MFIARDFIGFGRLFDFVEIRGTSNANLIVGSDDSELIFANGGHDFVFAGGGNDIAFGGTGRDTIVGGAGDDILFGGNGTHSDILIGGDGADLLAGGAGDDVLIAGSATENFFDAPQFSISGEGAGLQSVIEAGVYIAFHDPDHFIGPNSDPIAGYFTNQETDVLQSEGGDLLPQIDMLQGGVGADVFDVSASDGRAVIMDFDPTEGDALILSDIIDGSARIEFEEGDAGSVGLVQQDEYQLVIMAPGVSVDDLVAAVDPVIV